MRLCIALMHFTVGGLFLVRKPLNRSASAWQLLSAVPSLVACGMLFRFAQPTSHWPWYASSLFVLATCFAIGSLLFLGRNFAVLPAVRGISTDGPYRYIRHPTYAAEFTMALACVLALPGYRTVLAIAILLGALVYRIRYEEQLLLLDNRYVAYCQATRWRLLPGVW